MSGVHVISLSGDLDICEKPEVATKLGPIESFAAPAITILDLRSVLYAGSMLLNEICQIRSRLERTSSGSSICIVVSRNNFIWRLFEITALDTLFRLFESMDAARSYASSALEGSRRLRYADPDVSIAQAAD